MHFRIGGIGFAAAGVLVACGMSCRQIVGITSNPPGDPTSTCGLPYGNTACAECVYQNCCPESSACASQPDCAAYSLCLGACALSDWSCRTQCQLDQPFATATQLPPLSACMASRCESACGLTCGGVAPGFPAGDAAAACFRCVDQYDCQSAVACATSPDCIAFGQCTAGASTPDVASACGPDAGRALAAATVQNGPCLGDCNPPNNWNCLGNVRWPIATDTGTTVTVDVTDALTNAAVAGAAVSLCRFTDVGCSVPFATGVTGSNGIALLPVPAGSAQGEGALGADTYAQVTAPSLVSALYFVGYPISQMQAQIANPFVLVYTPSQLTQSLALYGATWDRTQGFVVFQVLDCGPYLVQGGNGAAGVRVSLDVSGSETQPFYVQGDAIELAATQTYGSGIGGFVNVPPGIVTLTATIVGLGRVASREHILVQAGTESVVFMYPTPAGYL